MFKCLPFEGMKANHVTRDKAQEAEWKAISRSRATLRNSAEYKSASKAEREGMEAADKAAVQRAR
jgi:hypothetical protein